MFGQLVPCGGGLPVPLLKPRLVVGRTAAADVTLPFATISSKHCLLELRDGVWFVTDLESRNGIRIDGARCKDGRLAPHSILSVAQQRYQVEYLLKDAVEPVPTPQSAPKAAPARRDRETTVVEISMPPSPSRLSPPHSAASSLVDLGELIPCGGGAPIPLTKPSLMIGRLPNCDITLPFPLVSAQHCQLEFKEGFWHVRDLGSRNGVRVDGIFQLAKYLKPGEVLWIAKHRYEVSYTPLADEPPPDENPFALGLLEKAGLAGRGAGGIPPKLPPVGDDRSQKKRWSIDENDVT